MAKPSKRTSEINHLKEQAQKERLMKATAQAQITSYRCKDDDLKFNLLPRKGNDTYLSSSIKHVLPNYHMFVKALNSSKLYHPFLGLDDTDPTATHHVDVDLILTTANNKINNLLPPKNGENKNLDTTKVVAARPRKKSKDIKQNSKDGKVDAKDKKVTPTKDKKKLISPLKPRPPHIKLPKPGDDKKASRTSSVQIESILKEMTQMDPPLTEIKTPKKDQSTEFTFNTLPDEKNKPNKDKQKGDKKNLPSSTKKSKKKSPLKVLGTRLSADDQQTLPTEKKTSGRRESVSHIIDQMKLVGKKGTTSSSSSSGDDSSSDSSESGSSDSEDETTTNKPDEKKEKVKPPDKATPLLNNNNYILNKTDITHNTTKSNDCGVSNDSNDSHFGLKFPLEKSSVPKLSSVAVDENPGPLLEGKDIGQIIGIEPYIGKPISPISPLDMPSNLFDDIIPCRDPSANEYFTVEDLLGTSECKDPTKDFTDSVNTEEKTVFDASYSAEEDASSSLLLQKKGNGTLYQKDSKKDAKPERRNSNRNKDPTQNKKTDERNKQSSKSNETKDKSKSKNTRIDGTSKSIKVTSGSNSQPYKTKAELKMPVSNINIADTVGDQNDIEAKTKSRSSRQRSDRHEKNNGKIKKEVETNNRDIVIKSESMATTAASVTLSNSTSTLKRTSPVALSLNDEILSKKPTIENDDQKASPNTMDPLTQEIKTEPFSLFGSNDSGFNETSESKEANSIFNDLNKLINEPEEPSLDINRLLGPNSIFQNGPTSGIRSIISPLKSPEHLKFDIPFMQPKTEEPPNSLPNSTSSSMMETKAQSSVPPLQEPPLVATSFTHMDDSGIDVPSVVSAMLTRTTSIDAPPFSHISSMLPTEPRSVNNSNHLMTSTVTKPIPSTTTNCVITRNVPTTSQQQLNNATQSNNFISNSSVASSRSTQIDHNRPHSNDLNASTQALDFDASQPKEFTLNDSELNFSNHSSSNYLQPSCSSFSIQPLSFSNSTTGVESVLPSHLTSQPIISNQVPSLNAQVMSLNRQVPSLNSQVPSLNGQIPSLNSQLPSLNSQVPSLNAQVMSLNSQVPSLNSQVPSLNGQVPSLNSQVSLLNTQVMSLNGQVPSLNSQVPSLNGQVPSLNSRVPLLNSQIPSLNGQVPSLNSQVPSLNSQVPSLNTQIPSLNSQVPSLNSQVPSLNTQVPSLNGQISSLNSQAPSLDSQVPSLNSQVPSLNSQVPSLNSQVPSLNSQVPSLNGPVPPLNSQVPSLNASNTLLNGHLPLIDSQGTSLSFPPSNDAHQNLPVESINSSETPLTFSKPTESTISTIDSNPTCSPTLNFTKNEVLSNEKPVFDQKPRFIPIQEKPDSVVNVTAEMPYVSPKEEVMEIAEEKESHPPPPPPPPVMLAEPTPIKEEPQEPPVQPVVPSILNIKEEDTSSPGNCFDMIEQLDKNLTKEKPGKLIIRIPLNLIKLKDSTISNYKNRTKTPNVVCKSPNGEDMEIDILGDDSPLKRKLPSNSNTRTIRKVARIESSTEGSDNEEDVSKNLNEMLDEKPRGGLIVRIPLSKLNRIPQKPVKVVAEPIKEEVEPTLGGVTSVVEPETVVNTVFKKKRGRKPKEKSTPVTTPTTVKQEEINTEPTSCSRCGGEAIENSRNPQRLACYKNTYTTYLKNGRTSKHRADCLTDEIEKAHMYIEAVLNYLEYLVGLEQSAGKMSSSEGVGEFMRVTSECMKLVEYVITNYSRKIDPLLSVWDKRFLFLCFRLQCALNLKLYKMKKESAKKYSKILSQYYKQYKVNSIVGRSPYTKPNQRGSTGTPSPSSPSPGPSPGGSVASVGSAGSTGSTGVNDKNGPSMVTIPTDMHEKGFNFMQNTKYLISAHRLWDESDNLQNHIQRFVQSLTKKTGVFTMQSTLLHTVDYVRAGILIIQESRKPS